MDNNLNNVLKDLDISYNINKHELQNLLKFPEDIVKQSFISYFKDKDV